MRTKTKMELVSIWDALRAMERAQACLMAGHEKLLAGRLSALRSEVEIELNKYEVVSAPAYNGKTHE